MPRGALAGSRTAALGEERGAALLEFAIVLPLLLAILVGIVTAGSALNRNNSLNNATRETARFAATLPADDLKWWLNKVSDVALAAATGDLSDGVDGRHVCVAFVHPAGSTPTDGSVGSDHTVRLDVDAEGARKVTAGSACFDDGRPQDERRVQVLAQREADLEFFFFARTVTLGAESAARYERFE
jgi:hypothetical protein